MLTCSVVILILDITTRSTPTSETGLSYTWITSQKSQERGAYPLLSPTPNSQEWWCIASRHTPQNKFKTSTLNILLWFQTRRAKQLKVTLWGPVQGLVKPSLCNEWSPNRKGLHRQLWILHISRFWLLNLFNTISSLISIQFQYFGKYFSALVHGPSDCRCIWDILFLDSLSSFQYLRKHGFKNYAVHLFLLKGNTGNDKFVLN